MPRVCFDQLQSVGENGQRGQAEEVHLQQAHLFDGDHVEGGDDFVVLGPVQRDQFSERARRNYYAGRVHAGVAHHAFEFFCSLNQLANLAIFFHGLAELRGVFDGLIERDIELRGDHLRDAVDIGVRDVHGAAYIFDRGFRGHGAEGDDLRHIVAAIFLRDVVDDFAAPVHAEIDVDIGHGNALWIQEALEEQFVLQRVDIGDSERVRNQRSGGRAAARADGNVVLFSVANEIPDDEEISGEFHLLDDREFALQALLVIGDRML